MAQQVQK